MSLIFPVDFPGDSDGKDVTTICRLFSHYFLVFSEIASVESMIPIIQVVGLGREHFVSSLWVFFCSYLNNVAGERGAFSPPTGGAVGRPVV